MPVNLKLFQFNYVLAADYFFTARWDSSGMQESILLVNWDKVNLGYIPD